MSSSNGWPTYGKAVFLTPETNPRNVWKTLQTPTSQGLTCNGQSHRQRPTELRAASAADGQGTGPPCPILHPPSTSISWTVLAKSWNTMKHRGVQYTAILIRSSPIFKIQSGADDSHDMLFARPLLQTQCHGSIWTLASKWLQENRKAIYDNKVIACRPALKNLYVSCILYIYISIIYMYVYIYIIHKLDVVLILTW